MRHAASLALLLMLSGPPAGSGESPDGAAPAPALRKPLTLELCDETLKECCAFLCGLGTIKVRCEERLAGAQVSLRVNQMPAASVFRHLARLTGTRALIEKDGTVLLTGVKSDLPEVPSLDPPPEVRRLTTEEEKRLAELIRQLGSEDFNARQAASEAIRSIGPPAAPLLRAALSDKDQERAQRAQALIDEFGSLDWRKEAARKLQKRVTFEFVQAPLTEAVNFMQSVSELNMVIDPPALADGDRPITLKMTQAKLDIALDWIARMAGRRWELCDHAILLTRGAAELTPAKPSETVREALGKKVNLEFKDSAFEECLSYLRGLINVDILTDPQAFGKGGADPRTPVTLKLEGATLEEVLGKLLAPLKLRMVFCKGDVIFITRPEKKPGG